MRTHGTRSCYVGGCRCDECTEAQRAYGRDYWTKYRRFIEGVPDVDPALVLKHLANLRAQGMGIREIARAANLGPTTVRQLVTGRRRRGIRPATARALLAVQLDPWLVDATPLTRRVRALATLGWRTQDIADAAGLDQHVIGDLSRHGRRAAQRDTAAAIKAVYERLCMTPGPSPKGRARAVAKGWLPPLAWDDIDDLNERPGRHGGARGLDESAILRKMRGEHVRVTHEERREVVRRLHTQGLSDGQITRLTGINGRQVLRDRQRLGLAANDMGRVSA